MSKGLVILALVSTLIIDAAPSTGQVDLSSYNERNKLANGSLLKNYPSRNVGPVVQGGRITDIEVNKENPNEYLVAYASGGIFKTVNNGISFEPIFDNIDALGIGDMALAKTDANIIYVGTGEKNSSRSSYAGSGVYKSIDGGQTWQNIGLIDSQHIGRIIIHPENPDVVWVASVGSLYSHNESRGVYKTTNGGETWSKKLFINDSTGIIDLEINPANPNQLWASAWERTRKAHNFKGSGIGSGIFRSNDGGERWVRIMDGFPDGEQVGRIGLDVSTSSPNVVYAFLDNQAKIISDVVVPDDEKLKIQDFEEMSINTFNSLNNTQLDEFLSSHGFPKKYTADRVKKDVQVGKYPLDAISTYFGDTNPPTTVVGAELYRSDDSGSTWKKMNSYDLKGVYFSFGYYFGEVRVDPKDPDLVYIFGVPLLKSTDGGVNYHRLDSIGDVHVDHQALWIDPKDSKHLLLGNDGGLYDSYDQGANWRHLNNMPVGQFYTINVDMEKPYNIYGGLQDNGTLVGSSRSIPNRTKEWEKLFGGDGMFVAPNPTNSNVVYSGFQFGNYFRINREQSDFVKITPQHDIGESKLRFNWRTPLKMSVHNPDIVYIASQRVHRSMDRGNTWRAISPDLTKNKPQGNVPFSTISALSESPLKFGLLFAGTDDGNIQVSRGDTWENVTGDLPKNKWVSSIFASPHSESEVFVTLNGYREDDFKCYAYWSEDFGKTWKSLKGNLPDVVVNDLIQDPVNPSLLYMGTDHGAYVSLDKGSTWDLFSTIPNVSCYDLMIHPRDNELIIGTHGRSIYVLDVKLLQQIAVNKEVSIKPFDLEEIRWSENWGKKSYPYLKASRPEVLLKYYLGRAVDKIQIEIYDAKNNLVRLLEGKGSTGFNQVKWDVKTGTYSKKRILTSDGTTYAGRGVYFVKFSNGINIESVEVAIK